ncbi:MAG: hypothetical protein R3B09_17720 [Nannocystaceae bacterium]
MPSTNDSRAIKITANTNNVNASVFDVNFLSAFSASSAVTVTFSDDSDKTMDKTIHGLSFADAATGAVYGSLSIRVKSCANTVGTFSPDLSIDSRGSSNPPATGGASQIRNPTNSNLRKWVQTVTDAGGTNVLKNVAVIDIRTLDGSASVSENVTQNDDGTYAMAVTVSTRAGTLASGTITLTTTTTTDGGYVAGKIVITDTEDDGPAARTVIR